ncbi:hypothetical protein LTR91_015847 [Friedmanniomyces endolithicus]|uniref:Uncharacterized protein n=1 Tax=Friedmanniomyces endolithicus TaxID=329885 RepID=A0AAN6J2W2_9PEZI|nr:hypothetical protein LTS00_016757 [Friedmanniomyces endolithicus]KAK0280701.1 hypothetical protein LTR35_007727 [Friedmanniomyces endolithicus]KAK0312466.1 hypothetical protein LTR82_013760 [Friedmanniomyces endolithicus]KAK0970553.1 hypothetical protein LTR91_015847 [Friedmanniomyces endolithicus]KAK1031264.1 hypothetical protein LTS16_018151 [Friedmanniomyces endolithicus]
MRKLRPLYDTLADKTSLGTYPLYKPALLHTNNAMKCHKPGTDQSLELVLFANGRPCAEYELPTAAASDPSVVRSFVPVEDGQELTVRGTFTGSCLYGSFDLIADGSFLADKRIEAPKDGKIRHYTDRKVDFRSVFDAPKMKGHTSVFPPDRVVEGNLHVKTLGERSETAAAFPSPNEFGIGSLVILVSLNQRTDDNHTSKYKSLTCGDPDIGRKDDDDGGIPPSYELMVRVLEGEVSKARQAKHKRHSEQTRFGPKPWAKLTFHYRSKASLQQFGCVERNGDSQGLEPSDPATFVRSSIEGARPKTRNGIPETSSAEHNRIFNTPPPDQILQAQYDRTDRAEATPHRRPREAQRAQLHRSSSIPSEYSRHRPQTNASPSASSMPSTKGKLMGQSLNFPVDFIPPRLTNHASKEHPQSYIFGAAMHDDDHGWEMQELAQGEEEEKLEEEQRLPGQTPSFDEFNQEVASEMSAQERADAMEDAQASATPSGGLHSAPVAQMIAPIDPDRWKDSTERTINEADGKEQSVEVKEEEQMEEASPRFLHLPAETWSFPPLSEHIAESDTEDHIARVSRTMSPAKIPQTVTLQSMHMQLSSSASEAVGRSTSRGGDSYDGLRERATTGLALDDRQTYFDGEGRLSQRYPGERSLESVEQVGRPEDKAPHSAAIQSSRSGSPSRPQPHVAAFSAGCNIEASPFVPASIASLSKPTFREDSLTPTSPSTKRADTSTKDDASPAPNYKIEISKKRSASISAASRESTPASKKPRFLELAVRKTELKRQIEEKQKRKAAAQKLLEERQKLRKEEERFTQEAVERQKLHDEEERMREETEELEVATLERMVLEEDEETEILEGLAVAEETLLSEAKAGRKRAEEALQANEEG